MTSERNGADQALQNLINTARRYSLLDDVAIEDGIVRLAVGTFEIDLDRESATEFLRGLLTAYEKAKSLESN